MRRFSVSSKVIDSRTFNIGIAPGKFDTKQLILSGLAVLNFYPRKGHIRFVRTLNPDELSKCQLFINDDFTTMFPVIPSYHDVKGQWEEISSNILVGFGMCDEDGVRFVTESVSEKICNLEAIDCLMDLYFTPVINSNFDSFESALEVTLKLIEKEIRDSIDERVYYSCVKVYIEKATKNYIIPPMYVQGWRNIVANVPEGENIDYAVFPDHDGTLVIESFDKDIIMKKYVKGMNGISYSGRFFVKVSDINTAEKVIERLPKASKKDIIKFA